MEKLLKNYEVKKMRKILFVIMVVLSFNISLVFAHEHNFTETKQFIDSGISCDKLTDEQLEAMGDYYMEQMHPGDAHELMDQMMGGEGSDTLKQMHIQMAKRLYCNEDVGGMMGSAGMMSSGMMGGGMMSSGMMKMMGGGNMMDYGGMMGYGSWGWWSIFSIINYLLIVALIIAAIYWLIKNADRKR